MPRRCTEFNFSHIVFLSNRDLLLLLQNIDNVTLLLACKLCDDLLIQRIASQFSNTARDYFFEDMIKFDVVAKEDSLIAQKRIGYMLGLLYEEGKLLDWNSKFAS